MSDSPKSAEKVLLLIEAGELSVSDPETTNEVVCNGVMAARILTAEANPSMVVWAGKVSDDLDVELSTAGSFVVSGQIGGKLHVGGAIGDRFLVRRGIGKGVNVHAEVSGAVELRSYIGGDVRLRGRVGRNVFIDEAASVGGDLSITGGVDSVVTIKGTVVGEVAIGSEIGGLSIDGEVQKRVWVQPDITLPGFSIDEGAIVGGLVVDGKVTGDAICRGAISGAVVIREGSNIQRFVLVGSGSCRTLEISGSTHEVEIFGSISESVAVTGIVSGFLSLAKPASIAGEVMLRPLGRLKLNEFSALLGDTCHLGENVDLGWVDLREFASYDQLNFFGSTPFPLDKHGRQHLKFARPSRSEDPPEEHNTLQSERAAIYRQLRRVLEDGSNRPAASDFYYGETEARRRAATRQGHRWIQGDDPVRFSDAPWRRTAEWWVLSAYKWLSGYGTRALFAVGWFAFIAVAASVLFAIAGVNLNDAHQVQQTSMWSVWPLSDYGQLFLFSVRSMVSFFSPPQGQLTAVEQALQLSLRFIGPVLIAQALLAVRERVAR